MSVIIGRRSFITARSIRIAGIALGTIALALAASEGILRVGFGFGHPLLYARDAQAGYVPAADQRVRRFGVTTTINHFGMRSDAFPASRPAAVDRLLFIGDSVTFGTTHVAQDKIFTERIKVLLSERNHEPVEVLNASAGGWAPDNEYRYLESRGTFDATTVVMVLNSGDLDQPFASFESSPQYPTANPRSALYELWNRYLRPRIDSSIQTNDPGSMPEQFPDRGRVAHMFRTLDATRTYALRQGAAFEVIFTPANSDIEASPWKDVLQELRAWCGRENVALIDMTPLFAHYPGKNVFLDQIHLAPLGHELVAEEFVAHATSSTDRH